MSRWPERTTKERFEGLFTRITESGCWLWTGHCNTGGYGKFTMGNETLANRVSYILYIGPIPKGLHVLHVCDVPCCVNPAHLFVGDDRDNCLDAIAKGRWPSMNKTHCSRGHEYNQENTGYKANGTRVCKSCHRMHDRLAKREKRKVLRESANCGL